MYLNFWLKSLIFRKIEKFPSLFILGNREHTTVNFIFICFPTELNKFKIK